MSSTPRHLSPPLAPVSHSASVAAPVVAGQVVGTNHQLIAAQTALRLVRMALLISTTPEEQNACLVAFVSQANRVMQLSGWEASE